MRRNKKNRATFKCKHLWKFVRSIVIKNSVDRTNAVINIVTVSMDLNENSAERFFFYAILRNSIEFETLII